MGIHDWTRVDAGLFHAFHHGWIEELSRGLNGGVLPSDYYALPEQRVGGPIPDVLTLQLGSSDSSRADDHGGAADAQSPPKTRITQRTELDAYARKANRIVVRHRHGQVVAVVEILSPRNKASQAEFRNFVEKTAELIRQGVHVLVIDLFPPGKRDPLGVHKAIWDQFEETDIELPKGKRLTLASYDAGAECVAYVEFVAVGDALPEMPLFLTHEIYVPAPLDETYHSAWDAFPRALKGLLESPAAS